MAAKPLHELVPKIMKTVSPAVNNAKRKVLLTPMLMEKGGVECICVGVRDPATEEIVAIAINASQLAERAGIMLSTAEGIFAKALEASEKRGPLDR